MLFSSVSFATMTVLVESLRGDYHWLVITFFRSLLAMVFAASLVVATGGKFVVFRPRTLWMRSLAGSSAMLLGFYAMTHFDVAVVSTLTNMYPIWVVLLSWPLLGEIPRGDAWVAAIVSVGGVCLLSFSPSLSPSPEKLAIPATEILATTKSIAPLVPAVDARYLAIPAAVAAAFFSGIALIGLHRLKGLNSKAVVAHFSAVSTSVCGLACVGLWLAGHPLVLDGTATSAPWQGQFPVTRLIAVGLFATLGQIFLTRAFAAAPPARISVVGLSQIAFVVLLKWCVFGAASHWNSITITGMALIVGATAYVMTQRASAEESHESVGTKAE